MRTILTKAPDPVRTAYAGGRVTQQRRRIAESVAALPGAFTIDELAEVVRVADPSAGATATVYRAVAAMEASGYLARVGSRDGSALYARCGASRHHHHIVCDGCGRIAHADCPLDATRVAAESAEGFIVTRHEVTLYGLCPACAATGRGA